MITCSENPSKKLRTFINQLYRVIPNSSVRSRPKVPIKKLIEGANKRNFTDLIIINEDRKQLSKYGWYLLSFI